MKTQNIRNILVPIDFTDLSLNAIKTATHICQRQGASLTLFHVVEYFFVSAQEANMYMENYLFKLKAAAEENLGKIMAEITRGSGVQGDVLVEIGDIANTICNLVVEKKMDLIVMGTHGTSGMREFFIGSNAYRVVKHSRCPVLTVPPNKEWLSFRKILFPVRMIPEALDKYDLIRPIIKKNNSTLIVLGLSHKDDGHKISGVVELVERLNDKLREDEVTSETIYGLCQNFPDKVLNVARKNEVDLIVITSTLDTITRKFFMGPYGQQIVNHSKVPVLSIRPGMTRDWRIEPMDENTDYFELLTDMQ